MGFLKRERLGGGLFKLYRADVELSCPRTPAPTSDGQWEECPAAGSIMHFQHLKTMSVRSTTPSQKTQILQHPSSIDFICCIPHQYLCCHPRIISFQTPMLRSFILLTLIFTFFLHKTIWHQDTTTDKLASRFQNRQFCTEHAVFLCSITTER